MAALTTANRLGKHRNVIVLTKAKLMNGNSAKAQGGVAVTVSKQDSWESHFQDTLAAGCHFNDKQAVEILVRQGPAAIWQMINAGLAFDQSENGELLLGKEGAHMERRILHAGGDATGKAMMDFLVKNLPDSVTVIEDETVLELIVEDNRCIGVISSNQMDELSIYYSSHVVLATGGCGSLYQITSNDPAVVGNGIALAYRAGAELSDLEFMQFHPTMLYKHGHSYGLVSEAVRGEGAVLISEQGRRIMENLHPLQDLAPRDVVARAIQNELNQGRQVFLDVTMIRDFAFKFPTITDLCEQAHIRLESGRIPVAPGAHFLMGGVKTNAVGETTIEGLYAVGETACTGVHGANRLASNSLLEGIVFANRLADHLLTKPSLFKRGEVLKLQKKVTRKQLLLPTKKEIQALMSKYAGIERTGKELIQARKWLESFDWQPELTIDVTLYTNEQMEIINMLSTSWLIVTSALARTESRGGHYRKDFPVANNQEWGNQHVIRVRQSSEIAKQTVTGVGK